MSSVEKTNAVETDNHAIELIRDHTATMFTARLRLVERALIRATREPVS